MTRSWEIPEAKYFNSYEYDTETLSHDRGYLGDATREPLLEFGTSEDGGWYGDRSRFPSSTSICFLRGGYFVDESKAGAFTFSSNVGGADDTCGFRLVLAFE